MNQSECNAAITQIERFRSLQRQIESPEKIVQDVRKMPDLLAITMMNWMLAKEDGERWFCLDGLGDFVLPKLQKQLSEVRRKQAALKIGSC